MVALLVVHYLFVISLQSFFFLLLQILLLFLIFLSADFFSYRDSPNNIKSLVLPLASRSLPLSLVFPATLLLLFSRFNWESGRAVEIALTQAMSWCAIHLLFYYAVPGPPGCCRSICHRPRSLITGICHCLASLLMLSSPP